ncbi:MAG: hypothetical protein Athens101426_547 [Parcubacteria group bacterium Athens1014_26]|nr:MAG: hypothetical protein Athens101426_547 [Parcubacteria group bacterium Athens1014_26]
MNSTNETFETLWKYCISNNRLCPKLEKWNNLYDSLKNREKLSGHGGPREPADPYILYYNWDQIIPIEKQFQFERYIQWASDNNQLEEAGEYLRSLPEDDWIHFGEI